MAKRLKDVKVKLISILSDDKLPSNRQGLIVKSEDGFSLNFVIKEMDAIKGLIYATPMKANYEDTDGEYYTNEDVEKAAHEFMKGGIENRSDLNHTFEIESGVYVVESYIEKSADYVWNVALDVSENETLMEKAKKGTLTGVSIAGTAKVIDEDVEKAKGKDYKDKEEDYEEDEETEKKKPKKPKEEMKTKEKVGELTMDMKVESNLSEELELVKQYNVELEKTITLKEKLIELDKEQKGIKEKPKKTIIEELI